jgi:hypothetical protein
MSGGAPEVEVIRLWVKDGRLREVDSLRPDEIGGAQHRRRLLLCAIIDGIIYLERTVAREVREPMGRHLVEVYALDTLFADNTDGASRASATRIAAALGLSERTVRRLRHLLTELKLLGRQQRQGFADLHWPIIPRTLASSRMSKVWWLDATSDPHPGTPDTYRRPGLDPETPDTKRGAPRTPRGGTPDTKRGDPGHEAYTSSSDISGLGGQSLWTRIEWEEREGRRPSLSSTEDPDRDAAQWRVERSPQTPERKAAVAAMAREWATRQQREERQRSHDPDAAARAVAGDAELRARAGITSEGLEEALASLQRLQGRRE